MNRIILITILAFVLPMMLFAQIGWTEHVVDSTFDTANSVYAADVDGDGDMDVLGACSGDDDITWWENTDGIGTSWTEHTIDANFDGANSVYAADVDDDGDVDVLAAAYMCDDITWWENTDGTGISWTEHLVDSIFDGASSVYAVDVDGDEDTDVLGAAQFDDNITWWENTDGTGTSWTEHTIDGNFNQAISVYAADVDGDGYMDVLGAAGSADDITWWENLDGTGTSWTEHTIDNSFDGPRSIYAADVDNDGDVDVLAAAYMCDDITWWENLDDTGTTWTEHTINGDFDGAWAVCAADVDGDGYMDVLGVAYEADDITWWENTDGTGTNWTEHTIEGNFNGARSVYAADIDGDAAMDVLGAAREADDITWWESDLIGIHDVGMVSIDIPSTLPLDTTLYPQATVTNSGTIAKSFNVTFEIDPGAYTSTDSVYDLAPVHNTQITFPDDFTFVSGFYTITVYTQLLGDENSANDTLEKVVDVGIAEGNSVIPETFVFNTTTISKGRVNIELAIPTATKVNLLVYDAIGRLSQTLISRRLAAGTHNLNVNLELPAGVYFYNLKTESGRNIVKKFLLIE